MALLFTESFDCAAAANLIKRYSLTSNFVFDGLVTGRTGQALKMIDTNRSGETRALPVSGSTCITGIAVKFFSLTGGQASGLLEIKEGVIQHITLWLNSTGFLEVRRGAYNGTLLDTSSVIVPINEWRYLELKVAIDDSAGTYEVRMDGVTFGGLIGTSQDTRNGGAGTWDRVRLGCCYSSLAQYIDDWYICDGSGSVNNDFLGPVQIIAKLPQTDAIGGAGGNTQFALSTGSDQGALVDEADPNDDTDYVSDATVGHRVTFNYPAVGLTGTVLGVVTNPYLRKTDAGTRTCASVARIGGVNYDHPNAISPETAYDYRPQIWELSPVSPGTNPWTVSEINGAEFGLKVQS